MILLVTGQMRSGASAVASAIHMLGCPMAAQVSAPFPPAWRWEWEDPGLTQMLSNGQFDVEWMRSFLNYRVNLADLLFQTKSFGLKSPYLALVHQALTPLLGLTKEDFRWIVVNREQSAVDESMARYPWLSTEVNTQIQLMASSIEGAQHIDFEAFLEDPQDILSALADDLQISSGRVGDAIAFLRK